MFLQTSGVPTPPSYLIVLVVSYFDRIASVQSLMGGYGCVGYNLGNSTHTLPFKYILPCGGSSFDTNMQV